VLLASVAAFASAQTPTCDTLVGDQADLAEELLVTQRPYDCCSDTIAICLKQKPTCSLAFRLSENICRRIAEGQSREKIVHNLLRRARTVLQEGNKAEIDLASLPVAGDESAPITLVEYAGPRCPYCADITLKMHDAIVGGQLKGKVKTYLKPFPIRSHEHSKESGLAFFAAARLGHFWEFVLRFYQRFDLYCAANQLTWAEAVGMDRETFRQTMAESETRELLVASKKEGIVNQVEGTPTFFINGRKYEAELRYEELVDVLEEEFERIKGLQYRQ
jgi:protein-disulfide isomerase